MSRTIVDDNFLTWEVYVSGDQLVKGDGGPLCMTRPIYLTD